MRHSYLPLSAFILLALTFSGCANEDNDSVLDLGSVSIGDQLIDLKKARDDGAISGHEYRSLKADLLTLVNNAATGRSAATDDDDDKNSNVAITIGSDHEEETEEDSGFLF